MRSPLILFGVALLVGSVAAPLEAQHPQKARRAAVGPDADGDGVPDAQDRCPNTPAGHRVGPDGCPLRLLLPGQQPPAAAPAPAPATTPAPTPAPPAGNANAGRPGSVTPQAAVRPTAAPGAAFTAGLAIPSYTGTSDADRDAYLRRFTQMLDSTIVTLIEVFRNTSGQPVAGAESPTSLSQRERDRWGRCRDLHFDLQSYGAAFHDLLGSLPATANVERTAAVLDTSLSTIQATAECDNITSMIAAPGRWTPWRAQYEATARRFYRDWYDQVREADDHNRAFVVAYNSTRPAAARISVPPAMPRTPPYVGAAPR
jgi:hypothetical protein